MMSILLASTGSTYITTIPMTDSVMSTVFGTDEYPDTDPVRVEIQHRQMDDRGEFDTCYLYDRCAEAIFDG